MDEPNRQKPPSTRPSLLLRVRSAQDAEAWREFEAAYRNLIVRYCMRRGMQLADAEDVQQTVLAKMSRSLRNFEYDPARGRFRSYLGRCVRNAIHSARSHKSAAEVVSLDRADELPADQGDVDERWHGEWVDHHLRRALGTLRATTDERTLAVFDAILNGRDTERIGAEFGLAPAAVRKVKQRVRDRLQEIVAQHVADEELAPQHSADA
jgi:RNA polymerase sigma factor (sigma-70 family)